MKSNALELAIISESKSFLSSFPCKKVIDAIHKGQVIYTPFSPIDILPDHYKHRSVSLYDPRKAPVLNQYRLIIPRTRYILEVCQFCLLLLLYFLVMVHRNPRYLLAASSRSVSTNSGGSWIKLLRCWNMVGECMPKTSRYS
jgi:hypothetical protein